MYVVNSFNVCGKSVSVFSTSTVYTVNPRFAFIRGGRFILSIKKNKENPPKRECSNRLYKAVVYLINNESRLRTFLDNPYGVMTNNATEEKFRELDLLRNGMMASDTCKGAENLTEFYSLYKTCMLHNVDFRSYMMKCITTMTLHMDKIEFEKDKRVTVTGYKAHHITSDVLDKLMPWNMA